MLFDIAALKTGFITGGCSLELRILWLLCLIRKVTNDLPAVIYSLAAADT